jgi:hypothetical protein
MENQKTKTADAEWRKQKAKSLRFKKPIVKDLNLDTIRDELWNMVDACESIRWFDNDYESLVNAMDGDEDDAYEFKMTFSDLLADLEQFSSDLDEEYVSQYFDILFPAIGADYAGGFLGYDNYEGDYFGLEPYEYSYAESEAAKKLMTLTKPQILEAVGQCLKIAYQYLAIKYRYDCLEAAIDILRSENGNKIKVVKAIEEQYDIANADTNGFRLSYSKEVVKFDKMLEAIPQEYWLQ